MATNVQFELMNMQRCDMMLKVSFLFVSLEMSVIMCKDRSVYSSDCLFITLCLIGAAEAPDTHVHIGRV